jgi:hypothetical protein
MFSLYSHPRELPDCVVFNGRAVIGFTSLQSLCTYLSEGGGTSFTAGVSAYYSLHVANFTSPEALQLSHPELFI